MLVIDPQAKTADVILPAGASTEVDNEIPGMNKGRIMRALQKEGIEQVRFYNTDGALGYRPDDSYFAEDDYVGPAEELGDGETLHTGRGFGGQTGK